MAEDDTSATTPQAIEVEGHGAITRAKPDHDDALGVEGRPTTRRADAKSTGEDDEFDVEGHAFSKLGRRQIDAVPTGGEPEVEGHALTARPPISVD